MKTQKNLYILLALVIVASVLLSACGGAAPTPASQPEPAATEPPAPTVAPTQPPANTEAPAVSSKYGGTLRHATQPPTNIDPAFLSTIPDDEIGRQWHDFLVFIGEDNSPDPARGVAESWDTSEDGLTWTFHLRQGIKFH